MIYYLKTIILIIRKKTKGEKQKETKRNKPCFSRYIAKKHLVWKDYILSEYNEIKW